MALTPKQERFIQNYLIDLNATQAAIRAGYSPKTANEQGSRLLANVSISRLIEAEQNKRAGKVGLDSEWVLRRLKDISDRCMQAEPVLKREGNEWVESGEYTFDSSGANKSTELIGKHLGMFKDSLNVNANMNVQIVDDIDD
jgi:phage terminase small subunit